MELKFASVLEFRRVEISQKAPWPQPLLELHNGKGRRISFPYILMIFPLYVLNGRWILSCVEFGWFWADLSWKIRENLGPGSFGFDIFFRIRAACTRFWTHWKDTKNRQNCAARQKRSLYVVKKASKKVASIHVTTAEILGVKNAWNRKIEPLKLIKTCVNWKGRVAKNNKKAHRNRFRMILGEAQAITSHSATFFRDMFWKF